MAAVATCHADHDRLHPLGLHPGDKRYNIPLQLFPNRHRGRCRTQEGALTRQCLSSTKFPPFGVSVFSRSVSASKKAISWYGNSTSGGIITYTMGDCYFCPRPRNTICAIFEIVAFVNFSSVILLDITTRINGVLPLEIIPPSWIKFTPSPVL